jgi:hypothetical protein
MTILQRRLPLVDVEFVLRDFANLTIEAFLPR